MVSDVNLLHPYNAAGSLYSTVSTFGGEVLSKTGGGNAQGFVWKARIAIEYDHW